MTSLSICLLHRHWLWGTVPGLRGWCAWGSVSVFMSSSGSPPTLKDTPISLYTIRSPSAGPIRDGRLIFQEADVCDADGEGIPEYYGMHPRGKKGLFVSFHIFFMSQVKMFLRGVPRGWMLATNSTVTCESAAFSSRTGLLQRWR